MVETVIWVAGGAIWMGLIVVIVLFMRGTDRHYCNTPSMSWPQNARPGDAWVCPECHRRWDATGDMAGGWLKWSPLTSRTEEFD